MQNPNSSPAAKTILTFATGTVALVLLILATQVEMPTRAILIAVAFSDIIFLILVQLGHILPSRRQ